MDSPLVRYNESDQPVCRVCNVVLKSDSHWEAHQASLKHHEAVNQLKANAANLRKNVSDVKPEPTVIESTRPAPEPNAEVEATKLPKPKSSSGLPADFFDNRETKRPKIGAETVKSSDPNLHKKSGAVAQTKLKETLLENDPDGLPSANGAQSKNIEHGRDFTRTTAEISRSESKPMKGALPEGFFDNKEADLLARGIKLVKPDAKDEYKEFEKLIQEYLPQVDNRLEEDEVKEHPYYADHFSNQIDAAVMIKDAKSFLQHAAQLRSGLFSTCCQLQYLQESVDAKFQEMTSDLEREKMLLTQVRGECLDLRDETRFAAELHERTNMALDDCRVELIATRKERDTGKVKIEELQAELAAEKAKTSALRQELSDKKTERQLLLFL